MRIAVSHLGSGRPMQRETVQCTRADIVYDVYGSVQICWKDGSVETLLDRESYDPLVANYVDYAAYLAGDKPRPHTTLEDSRPFVTLNALCYISSGSIHDLPKRSIQAVRETEGHDFLDVLDLEPALSNFVGGAGFPNFTGQECHSRRHVTKSEVGRLREVVERMALTRQSGASA